MSQKITIDSSIAAVINITNVGSTEIVPIYLTAPNAWIGDFKFSLFNSNIKNNEIQLSHSLISVNNNVMTVTIDCNLQSIEAGNYYYEISSLTENRILFKGSLNIIK